MKFFALIVVGLAGVGCGTRAAEQPAAAKLTIENLIDIKHPSNPAWSPDGKQVLFSWDRAGITNLYVSDGASAPRALTNFDSAGLGAAFWLDAQTVLFTRGGDLWRVSTQGGAASAVWTTPGAESSVTLASDGKRVAFVRSSRGGGADLIVRTLADQKETTIAHDANSIGGVSWSPDDRHVTYTAGAASIRHEQTPDYSGAKIIYTVTERTPSQLFVAPSAGGKAVAIGTPGGGARWLDATHLVFDRTSADFKTRTNYVADIATAKTRIAREDVDDKFWSITGDAGAGLLPSPDGKWLAVVSDRDGWDHIYVMPAGGGDAVQITKGKFEAWRPAWSPDSSKLAFDANEPDRPGTRHLGVATIAGNPATASIAMITTGRGTNIAPIWSPDGTRLVYQHTDPQNSADLYTIEARAGAAAKRLTDSMPGGIDKSIFVEPEFVHYPGPDGQPVPGWLYTPKGLDKSRKHPAIVWIHGDGVNQNYDGWHVQRNYAVYSSVHQYLLQQGYVVFMPDYRGSIGYGKAWRQAVYMDVGGKDAKDAWMAANYLKTLNYVDMDRVGVWGLSYGGFFTLIAVTDQPTLFRAGIDVAGVADYAMYYEDPYHGGWTASRIGTPQQNPAVYAQASPISHIDRLQRPLLILHGTADVNVPYLHSVRLIDEALAKGKGGLIDFMVYPGEFHYFTRAHVLRDAWQRVDKFFAIHLKGTAAGTY
ncbi:MAG TPA: prolyl oligopeptidase family serine peptidase [Vicinamibacterales bacterium]|nr:prolyl oligopeptidase family serine peptidase [Vicinamibacterales bacterium]